MATIVSRCDGAFHLAIGDVVPRAECFDSSPRQERVCPVARGRPIASADGSSLTVMAVDIRQPMAMNGLGLRRGRRIKPSYFELGRLRKPIFLSDFIPRSVSYAENHVDDFSSYWTATTKSSVQEDGDSGDRRQSNKSSSNTESDTQAESGNLGDIEHEKHALMGGNEDNNQGIPLGRKRMGRPKRKKKKAYCAGIAEYDSRTNTVRLKESVTDTPAAAAHGMDIKQQRQGSQEILGAEAKSGLKTGPPLEEVTGFGRELFSDNSTGKSLGVEEGNRLSKLLGLEESEERNLKLVTQDDACRGQLGFGGIVQSTVKSSKATPRQEFAANVPEVALKSRPTKKVSGAKEATKAKGLEQDTDSGAEQQPSTVAPNGGAVQSTSGASIVKKTSVSSKRQVDGSTLESIPKVVAEQLGQETSEQLISEVLEPALDASVATESVRSTAGVQVAESMSLTATQVTESVATPAAQFSYSLKGILRGVADTEDEFEELRISDSSEIRGLEGLRNFKILQEDQGILVKIRDFYFFMLKKPLPEFAMGMIAAPLALSTLFTLLYLPEFQGLAYDETARDFLKSSNGMDGGAIGLQLSWKTCFEVFMFSLSLSTGLEPDLAPLSPYTLVVANLNALLAQLMLAFMSAAVFARLSQPSQPVRCSDVALISSFNRRSGQTGQALNKVLLTRCVLAGPQPCELINVKVDLMYRFNTVTTEGSFSRGSYSLKLVRPQIALVDQGMLVRHIIDESSPLYSQTPESLQQDDAIFVLSVAGMERSSMQPIFHVQYYSTCDKHVIWNAEFEDMILINQKNQRVVDHSKLSSWRPL